MKNGIEDTSQSYSLAFEFSQNIYVFISITGKRSTFFMVGLYNAVQKNRRFSVIMKDERSPSINNLE